MFANVVNSDLVTHMDHKGFYRTPLFYQLTGRTGLYAEKEKTSCSLFNQQPSISLQPDTIPSSISVSGLNAKLSSVVYLKPARQ